MKPLLIGIAGGSASGKTTIAQCLKEEFEQTRSVVIIREDDYYKDQSQKTMAERVKTNYDHPFAFDHALMIEQIDALLAGQAIEKPVYDFVQHTRSTVTEVIEPCDVVVLEGLFVLEEPELRKRLNIKVYVDTDADIRFIRRLLRDVEERGRTLQSVVTSVHRNRAGDARAVYRTVQTVCRRDHPRGRKQHRCDRSAEDKNQ